MHDRPQTAAQTPRGATRDPAQGRPLTELIDARFTVPVGRQRLMPRGRLLQRLAASGDHALISMVAPPGYGKTSLLAQFAASGRDPIAWLTLDVGDNDPVRLFGDLATALSRSTPGDAASIDVMQRAGSVRAMVGRLLAVLGNREEPTRLVLDDAHVLTDRACLDALAEVVDHLPSGLQLILASRAPVDLPFSRWRSDGRVLDLGPLDLRMDAQEAGGLARHLDIDVAPEMVAQLHDRTEGWPVMLALALRAAARSPGVSWSTLPRGDIAAYLRAELLSQRTAEELVFLTRTSILEQLSGPYCDAVTATDGSAAMLTRLARSTLLVTDYGGAYRYHSLLRGVLENELQDREPALIPELHRRAAAWCAANDAIESAVEHAIATRDLDLATATVGRAIVGIHWTGRRTTIQGWLGRFREETLVANPWLAVIAAWEYVGQGSVASVEHFADIADRGSYADPPPDGTASFESGRAILRAAMCRRGAVDALAHATLAAGLEQPGSPWRDFALWILSLARVAMGDEEGADEALTEAATCARAAGNLGILYCILGQQALLAVERGDWAAAAALVTDAQALGVADLLVGYSGSAAARIASVRIAIHLGDQARARRELAQSALLRAMLGADVPVHAVTGLIGLARAHLAVGDAEAARTVMAQTLGVIRVRPDLGILPAQAEALRSTIAKLPLGVAGATALTAAELRVLAMLPYYLSFKEIGQRLGVSQSTIKTHAMAVYGKLDATSRSEAVEHAVAAGLLEAFALPASSASPIAADAGRGRRVLD